MQGLSRRTSVQRCLRAALFFEYQVSADSSVQEIAADMLAQTAVLRERKALEEEAENEVLRGMALGRRRDTELQTAIRVVGLGLIGRLNGSRASAIYEVHFPEGYGAMVRLTGEELLGAATALLRSLSARTDAVTQRVLADHGADLEAAIAAAAEAAELFEAAEAKATEAKSSLELARIDWLEAYFRVQRAFESHFTDNLRLAEVYFLRTRRSRKAVSSEFDDPSGDGGSAEPRDGAGDGDGAVGSDGADPGAEAGSSVDGTEGAEVLEEGVALAANGNEPLETGANDDPLG